MKLSNREYHRLKQISNSDMSHMSISMAHYDYYRNNPADPTPQQIFGAMYHAYMLEAETFHEYYIEAPEINRRTKAGKEEWAEFQSQHEGKIIITAEDTQKLEDMSRVLLSHEIVQKIFSDSNAIFENSIFAEILGVECKCRPDIMQPDLGILWDLKTIGTTADYKKVQNACANYSYDRQAAFYLDVTNASPEEAEYVNFGFIFQESKEPYLPAVFEVDEEMLEKGRLKYTACLVNYLEAEATGRYQGYPNVVQLLSLPAWAK